MTKNGKMQQVVMRLLATMLVVSFLLAAMSFVWPTSVHAEHYCYENCISDDTKCETCCDAYHCWTTGLLVLVLVQVRVGGHPSPRRFSKGCCIKVAAFSSLAI